jgi:hypothetical protein
MAHTGGIRVELMQLQYDLSEAEFIMVDNNWISAKFCDGSSGGLRKYK